MPLRGNPIQVHLQVAAQLLAGNVDRQLYRLVVFVTVPPDNGDLSQRGLFKFTWHTFATGVQEALQDLHDSWDDNFPEGAELVTVMACAPVPGESIEEGSLLRLTPPETHTGPRAVVE